MLGHPMAEHKGYSGTVRSRVWSDIASRGHREPGNQPDGDVRANSGITIGCGEKESWPEMHGEYVSVRVGTGSVEASRLKCGGASN